MGGKAHSLNQFKLARCRKMSPFFLPRLWVRKTKSPFSLIIHVCKWSYFCSSQSDVLSFCRRIPSVEQIRRNSLGDSKGQTGNNLIHPRLSYDNWCTGFVEFKKKKIQKNTDKKMWAITADLKTFIPLLYSRCMLIVSFFKLISVEKM